MPKLTQQIFEERVTKRNPTIHIIGKYQKHDIPIECECTVCGSIFSVKPEYLTTGKNCCKKCSEQQRKKNIEKQRLTKEDIQRRAKILHPNIEILGDYISYHEHILCRCSVDENIWSPRVSDLLQGKGCPMCALRTNGEKKRKTNEEFLEDFSKIDSNLILVGDYVKQTTKIKVKCAVCGYEWDMLPNNILKGRGCKRCNHSNGEKIIQQTLKELDISFEIEKTFQDCKNVFQLRYDFYLPEYNCCIEFDGQQHFEPNDFFGGEESFKKTQKRDKMKDIFCSSNNIPLLRIPYWEIDNIKDKIKNFLHI